MENQTICYTSGGSGTSCPAGTASTDRSNVQWTYDSVSGEKNTYTYDDHDRLTQDVITGGSNPRTYTFGYDVAGNRTSSSVTGSSPSSQTLTYNAANQITSTGYTYDGAGNLTASPTRTASFNAAGQQTESVVGGVHTPYTYAGTNEDEQLVEASPTANTYSYSYGRTDKNGQPIIDSIKAGTGSGATTAYVLSDPSGQPIMLQTPSAVTCLYLFDGIGNPVALSTNYNVTSYALRYDPYGAATRTDGTTSNGGTQFNPYQFEAGIQDRFTHEIRFGQRYYDPTTGNWTQQDTLNAPLDPSNANRYQYAASNPINISDATGRCFLCDAVGAVAGAITTVGVYGATGGNAAAAGGAGGFVGGYVGGLANGESQSSALGTGLAFGAAGLAIGAGTDAIDAGDE